MPVADRCATVLSFIFFNLVSSSAPSIRKMSYIFFFASEDNASNYGFVVYASPQFRICVLASDPLAFLFQSLLDCTKNILPCVIHYRLRRDKERLHPMNRRRYCCLIKTACIESEDNVFHHIIFSNFFLALFF